MIRRIPTRQRNASIVHERDRGAFFRLILLLAIGLVLAAGFVYAGRQHFVALKYGYETQNLRRVRDQLIEEQHRFLLAREEAASPMRLERAARQLGLQPLTAAQIDPLRRPTASALVKPSRSADVVMMDHPTAVSPSRTNQTSRPNEKLRANDKKAGLKLPISAKVSMSAKASAKASTKESRKKPI